MVHTLSRNALWLSTLLLIIGTSMAITTAAMPTADVTGVWQATLGANGRSPLQIVLRISKDSSQSFTGAAYSIDQGAEALVMRDSTLRRTSRSARCGERVHRYTAIERYDAST